MTATEGGPALNVDPAAVVGKAGGSGVTTRRSSPRLRTVLGLARVEGSLLGRSVLVLAGLLAGGFAIWFFIHATEPLWWDTAWEIGYGQLVLGLAVLMAAQLAAGRSRRDGMIDLYASVPATPGTRTLAHLIGLLGAVPASLLLIVAGVVVVEAGGPVGVPSVAVLAAGLLLVLAAGAAGVAIGTRFPHPLAGVLGALVVFVLSATTHVASGAGIWLLPWEVHLDQLGWLPGPLAGYPPVAAHALELAGVIAAAGIAALALTISGARSRRWLAAAGILAVAVISLAVVVQLAPIPSAALNSLTTAATKPASVQRCTTTHQVRYCLYPGFGSLLPLLEAPVNAVVERLPARPDQPLTVRQVLSLNLDTTLTHGHPNRQVSRWVAQLQRAPGSTATASDIYVPVGSWPAKNARLGDAQFGVALAAANWAVRIPPQAVGSPSSELFLPCVPLDQAREAIAIWLAIQATHPPSSELGNGLGTGNRISGAEVHNTFVQTWAYPGEAIGYVTPTGVPQNTAAGYLLASAMTKLPQQRVAGVLAHAWGRWLNWHSTDAQLARALGIHPPKPPGVVTLPSGKTVSPAGPPANGSGSTGGAVQLVQNPLCTS